MRATYVLPRILQRLAVTTVLGLRHVRRDPLNAAILALKVVPAALRAPLIHFAMGATPRRLATVRAVLLLGRGDRTGAASEITAALGRGARRRQIRRLGNLAIASGQASLARRVAARMPDTDPLSPRLRALVAQSEGHFAEALSILEPASDRAGPGEAAARQRLERELIAQIAALDPDRRPTWASPPHPGHVIKDRILHLVTKSLPHASAGYTVRTHMIVQAQRLAGLDPHVVTRLRFPVAQGVVGARQQDVVDGVTYHRLLPRTPLPAFADQRLDMNVRLAAELVEDLRPAVLHAATNHVNGQVAIALRDRYRLPVVYEVRGFLEESWLSQQLDPRAGSSDRYRLARELESYCMRSADAVVTLGESMKAEIMSRGVPGDRIHVMPNAVDDSFLDPLPDPAPVRTLLNAADGDVVVGIVSTFFPHEGIGVLVRATGLIRDRGARVRLALIGDGTERPALERLVDEIQIADITVFTGRVAFAAIRSYYSAIDIFVVPRTDDRVCHMVTPLKPIEAMAAGRAIVASRVGGLEEIITDGESGLLVPPEDPVALADALETLVYDEPLRDRLGAAARDWVALDRTWSRNADRYRSLYASLGGASTGG